MTDQCSTCQQPFGITRWRYQCPENRGGCGKLFCSPCLNYALLPASEVERGNRGAVTSYCVSCFKRLNTINFESYVDEFGPGPGTAPTIVFIHGGGGCRAMFLPHAKILGSRGIRCVLPDLPGHGSRMNEPLSLESAIQTIVDVTHKYAPPFGDIKPIYVGGSLGGYIGMELLGQYPELFGGAVIMMAGQAVGVDRGLTASIGLSLMSNVGKIMSAATLLNSMWSQAIKNGHISHELLCEISLRCGMFFQQANEQIEILRASNPMASLPKFNGRTLFINGTQDHRDSENRWLQASTHGRLINYEGADHFFSHDDRYFDRSISDIESFLSETNSR